MRRGVTPRSGRRRAAAITASTFSIGSPMPMKTTWSIGSIRLKCSAWSSISHGVRLRRNCIWPVAQNVHVSGQPDCDERQTERRPSRKRISTASTGWPSRVWKSALTVPVGGRRLVRELERRERHRAPRGARASPTRRSSSRRTTPRRAPPTPTPGGCGTAARRRASRSTQVEVHRAKVAGLRNALDRRPRRSPGRPPAGPSPSARIFTIRPFAPLTQRQARLSPELQTLLPSTW